MNGIDHSILKKYIKVITSGTGMVLLIIYRCLFFFKYEFHAKFITFSMPFLLVLIHFEGAHQRKKLINIIAFFLLLRLLQIEIFKLFSHPFVEKGVSIFISCFSFFFF